jgi:hypothetical protein
MNACGLMVFGFHSGGYTHSWWGVAASVAFARGPHPPTGVVVCWRCSGRCRWCRCLVVRDHGGRYRTLQRDPDPNQGPSVTDAELTVVRIGQLLGARYFTYLARVCVCAVQVVPPTGFEPADRRTSRPADSGSTRRAHARRSAASKMATDVRGPLVRGTGIEPVDARDRLDAPGGHI